MGRVDGQTARLWRHEFEKNGIGFDELVLIGNNLGELSSPTFIPNVFELIRIVKKLQSDPERKIAHERVPMALPKRLSEQEVQERRNKTKIIREQSMSKMRENFHAS